ncbi:MAG TPA: hypothetical protein VJM11_11975, partial [Nevskiaceae bacterium]|nr:hypothetical protein [Nevskiaceae bacterium]
AALEHSGWDARTAAALLAVSRPTMYRLLKRHGLQRPATAAAAVAAASHPATPSPRATEGGDVPGDTSRFD